MPCIGIPIHGAQDNGLFCRYASYSIFKEHKSTHAASDKQALKLSSPVRVILSVRHRNGGAREYRSNFPRVVSTKFPNTFQEASQALGDYHFNCRTPLSAPNPKTGALRRPATLSRQRRSSVPNEEDACQTCVAARANP